MLFWISRVITLVITIGIWDRLHWHSLNTPPPPASATMRYWAIGLGMLVMWYPILPLGNVVASTVWLDIFWPLCQILLASALLSAGPPKKSGGTQKAKTQTCRSCLPAHVELWKEAPRKTQVNSLYFLISEFNLDNGARAAALFSDVKELHCMAWLECRGFSRIMNSRTV